VRVGTGYDSHRFSSDRSLVLGGVTIPDSPGLEGHSDGDAVAHAVIDALLGAAGLGSIGTHFPDTDEQYAGADSMGLLGEALYLLEADNYQVVNVDVTVIAEAPRIGGHADAIATSIARVLRISPRNVNVKGKSNEGMGWIGRGEGLAVMAAVLIDQMADIDALHASMRAGG
jgi:2-C-methyl-D-erythritol 2,4-cyclodiphosphate synthase